MIIEKIKYAEIRKVSNNYNFKKSEMNLKYIKLLSVFDLNYLIKFLIKRKADLDSASLSKKLKILVSVIDSNNSDILKKINKL